MAKKDQLQRPKPPQTEFQIVESLDAVIRDAQKRWQTLSARKRRQDWPQITALLDRSPEQHERAKQEIGEDLFGHSTLKRLLDEIDMPLEERQRWVDRLIGIPEHAYHGWLQDPKTEQGDRNRLEKMLTFGSRLRAALTQSAFTPEEKEHIRTEAEQFRQPYAKEYLHEFMQRYADQITSLESGKEFPATVLAPAPIETLSHDFFPTTITSFPCDEATIEAVFSQPPFTSTVELALDAQWGKFYTMQHPKTPQEDLTLYVRMFRYYADQFEIAKLHAIDLDQNKLRFFIRHLREELQRAAPHERTIIEKQYKKGWYAEWITSAVLSRFCLILSEAARSQGAEHTLLLPSATLADETYDVEQKIDTVIRLTDIGEKKIVKRIGVQISTQRNSHIKRQEFYMPTFYVQKRREERHIDRLHYMDVSGMDALGLVDEWERQHKKLTPDMGLRAGQLRQLAIELYTAAPELQHIMSAISLVTAWQQRYPESYAAKYPKV